MRRKRDGSYYQYYHCSAVMSGARAHKCDLPFFQLEKVEAKVWNWIKELSSNPDYLKDRLLEYQLHQEESLAPLRERLAIVTDLIAQNSKELERALADLRALKGSHTKRAKARITADIEQIEETLDRLEIEQSKVSQELAYQEIITPELIEDVLGIRPGSFVKKLAILSKTLPPSGVILKYSTWKSK